MVDSIRLDCAMMKRSGSLVRFFLYCSIDRSRMRSLGRLVRAERWGVVKPVSRGGGRLCWRLLFASSRLFVWLKM